MENNQACKGKEKMTNKDKIIYEALLLFSKEGFEATSTRAIARAVHCSDAVIYKHFKSKKEILDAVVEICSQRFMERAGVVSWEELTWEKLGEFCLSMFDFQTRDEWIVPFRQLLMIEQFRNDEMKELYQRFFIRQPVDFTEKIFERLINLGYMKPGNPKIYAMKLYGPFFLYHTAGGGEDAEIRKMLKEHVEMFCEEVRM